MKKQALAAAIAVALGGGALNAQAAGNTTGLTGVWTGTYIFTMTSPGGGAVGVPTAPQAWTWNFNPNSTSSTFGTINLNNTATFYASVWTAHDVTFVDNGASYGGTNAPAAGNVGGSPNMFFDWSVNTNLPVYSDWDVDATGNAVADTAVVTVNAVTILANSAAFPGFHPAFSGTLNKVASHVPVPAAVWLMGSGLVGLVGVARRRRQS